ncbi:alpha/beta hydrolase [Bailinhaonella thermotolerans]|uniref:Alpha/beta hydrolase n=1 Tax=Bailinhaonella thermotolerans TaxID=1070861 RepID=A0A3A4A856_9ACTN|nr:alpha/beta hydrolase [Bailinhaonella thermotolerans]
MAAAAGACASVGEPGEFRAQAPVTPEPAVRPPRWAPCEEYRPDADARVECAHVEAPLDYNNPAQKIKIAVMRVRAAGERKGVLLVNPGGPGAPGRAYATTVAGESLVESAHEHYDVIGFDPRGVGASRPALSCMDIRQYEKHPMPDFRAPDSRTEDALHTRARTYAQACGRRHGSLLTHMGTIEIARDMDTIRAALGEDKISYLGTSWGSYLGAVYATLFPDRVDRLIFDGVVDPGRVWYGAMLDHDTVSDARHADFLAWVARHHKVYRLGDTPAELRRVWEDVRGRLARKPAGGLVGPSELDMLFDAGTHLSTLWPDQARILSAYARGDAEPLLTYFRATQRTDDNFPAAYLSIICRDAPWPEDVPTWRTNAQKTFRRAPFFAWAGAWENAPCLYWPVGSLTPMRISSDARVLLVQSRHDPATPYPGAVAMRATLPNAVLLTEAGGDHGIATGENPCVRKVVAAYLVHGRLPERAPGGTDDVTCPAPAPPKPVSAAVAGPR